MKRPAIIIIAALVVLVSLIGFDRIVQGWRFIVSDDRVTGARKDGLDRATGALEDGPDRAAGAQEDGLSSEVITTNMSSADGMVLSPIASRSDNRSSADATAVTSTEEHDPHSVAVTITGEISPIHFIRASTIFGQSKPSMAQIDRLREALAVIGDALRPSAIILDADGLTTSEAPMILFVRDEFDLTDQVKAVYDALEKTSNHPPQAKSKVEQAATERPVPAVQSR